MRLNTMLLMGISIASVSSGATLASAPVPADPRELATGIGKAVAKPADRTRTLELLNRAKRPMRFHAPITPAHLIVSSFTAIGDPSNTGTGELNELWVAPQSWRWTAKLGDFSVTRVSGRGETFEEKHVPVVPMRIHMLRNTIFWAGQALSAGAQFRIAAAEWNGRPTTCVLAADRPGDSETLSRRWDEQEWCIDDATGLLQILSFAPGNYTVYSYGKGQSFHDQPLPDRITTYVAGSIVLDASLRLDDSGTVDQSILTPIPSMLANGSAVSLDMPIRSTFDFPTELASSVGLPVMVNAQIGTDGSVIMKEICATVDPSLNAGALDFVKNMHFGSSDSQRQAYVQIRFVPANSKAAVTSSTQSSAARVPIEPYYLERAVSDPVHETETKEFLARRSDGAIMDMRAPLRIAPQAYVRELHFPDGRRVTIYDSIRTKTTWPRGVETHPVAANATDGPSDCAASSNGNLLRHEQMQGVDVDVVQQFAGSYRLTLSAAPRLGCQALAASSEAVQPDGSFRPSMDTKTIKLVVGEPEARFFEIGPDLVEMKPSEAQRRFYDSLELPWTAEEKAAFLRQALRESAEADRRYEGKSQ
jgi:hypothetical protein